MKFAKVLLSFLCATSTMLGCVGFYQNKKAHDKTNFIVDYIYYIDGTVVASMPENIGSYDFDNYVCTNKVTGEWNESEWKFTPNLIDSSSNCSLYFKTKTYEVKVDFVGGKNKDETYNGISTVKKGESLEFEVSFDEGIGFDNVECTNNETGSFNDESSKVIIGPFNNTSTCVVNFKTKTYSVKVETTNGTPGSETIKVEHSKDGKLEVIPITNYTYDLLTCNNNQEATWKDNNFEIKNVTSDTICILKFKLKSYKVMVDVENGTVDTESKQIVIGKSETFVITPEDGYTLDGATVDCGKKANGAFENSKLEVKDVTDEATCKVVLKEKEDDDLAMQEANEEDSKPSLNTNTENKTN